ncbi:flagellar hook capping FlgD N-terminal domain-containing protein [Clostridiaceae bacterium HSG29]|nr:flagellar hook capping FlgD N-terminal domain-containing protein [Clostridiaceae bacterium HSG29]
MDIQGSFSQANLDYLDSIKNDESNNKLIKEQEMGQDAFLKLLMAEMQYQDPLDPMDNKDTIAQMAQFTSVEQLGKINNSIETSSEESKLSLMELQNSIADLNKNLVGSGSVNEDKLDEINDNQTKILNEMIKLNNSLSAYFTESSTNVDFDI